MSKAIWMLMYDLAGEDESEYNQWFHKTHIPDKLTRRGYNWAGHYKLNKGTRHVALFGGKNSTVFFNPSPTQLKVKQDDLTRRMIALRKKSLSLIFCEEWTCKGPKFSCRPGEACELLIGNAEDDETFNAWLAQEFAPTFANRIGAVRARKLLCTTGPVRHGLLLQYDTSEHLNNARIAWPYPLIVNHSTPFVGKRLWPQGGKGCKTFM